MTTAYPLSWPDGWPRTPPGRRERSRFTVTPDRARRNLLQELERLGATPGRVVISSDVAVRLDGQPYADASRRRVDDPGVAVYFDLAGDPMVMARDLYLTPHENMHSIGHAIAAMRALERHGGDYMMKRAFSGFAALPAPGARRRWHEVLNVSPTASAAEIHAAHRDMVKRFHPDRGGSPDLMAEINAARDEALRERGA